MVKYPDLKIRLIICVLLTAFQYSVNAQSSGDYIENTVIFKVKPEFRALCTESSIQYAPFERLLNSLGTCTYSKKFPNHNAPRTKYNMDGIPLADLSLIYELTYTADVSLDKVVSAVNRLNITQYAQPHYLPRPLYTPNDDSASLNLQYHLNMIQAFAAWDSIKGDSNIVIGITDTGLDTAHIDLRDNVWYNYNDPIDGLDNDNDGFTDNFRGWDMADNDNDPSSTGIWWHHGTVVAGLASASTDNGLQGAGVGFKCRFIPIKVSRDSDGAFTAAYEGIVYAADHGCQIINCSWGGTTPVGQFEQDVIDYATLNMNALVIAAAGNSGDEEPYYPASLNYVISVGGTDASDLKFIIPSGPASNYGRYLDVCAPGAYIYSTTYPSNFGLALSGTSFSSPIVAGCAAIVKAKFPNYTALQIGEQLKVTAYNIDTIPGNTAYAEKLGSGRVDLFKAITDSSKPSIVMIKRYITDGNDEQFLPGEVISIRGTFKNYLAPTISSSTYVEVSSLNPNINVTKSTADIGSLNTLDTAGVYAIPFTFTIDAAIGYDEVVELRFEYRNGSDTLGYEYATITANPSVVNIDVNNISTSMTSETRIGFNDAISPDPVLGLGFQFNGENLIYEAGLMVGAQIDGTTYVSDNIWDSVDTDVDFVNVVRATKIVSTIADIEANALVNDDGAGSSKMDISVDHSYYAWSASPDENYVLMRFNIINNGTDSLMNLYAGISVDWDIRNFGANKATHDFGSRMGYVRSTEAGSPYAGVKLLSDGPYNHYAIDNFAGASGIDIYYPNAYSTAKKYIALSTNRQTAGDVGSGNDVIDVVSSGPHTLAPQDTLAVSFAMLAGDDLLDLVNTAYASQAMYDSLFGEPDSVIFVGIIEGIRNINLYPNPSNGSVTLYFAGLISEEASFEIIDIAGRILYTSNLKAGITRKVIDISELKAGMYQYRVSSTTFYYVSKLIIVQ